MLTTFWTPGKTTLAQVEATAERLHLQFGESAVATCRGALHSAMGAARRKALKRVIEVLERQA